MSEVVHAFTTKTPRWQPYVVPVDLETATEEQRAAMQVTPSNKGISPYVLTLAHDPESLTVRSPLFNLIMYGKDGLASSERELGATAASVVNHCVYCAAVHASRFISQTKRTDVIEAILAHKDPNGIRRAYNRARYWEQRQQLMQDWADILDELRSAAQRPSAS